jgi:hypothetical protein
MGKYSDVTVDRALTLMLFGTAPKEVSRVLSEEYGVEVTPQVVGKWRAIDYATRYKELHDKYKEEIEGDAIRRMRERLQLVDQAEMLAVTKVINDLEQGKLPGKDAAFAALNMSRVKAQNVEKLMQLTGRPTQVIEDKSGAATVEVLRKLESIGLLRPISNGHKAEETQE